MIEIIKLNIACPEESEKLQHILSRNVGLNAEIMSRTEAIIRDVTMRGDAAVVECTQRFDNVVLSAQTMRVQPEWIEEYRPEEKSTLAVLWDASKSMETRDIVQNSEINAAIR